MWSAYTSGDRREMAQVWEISAELADTPRQRIIDAGAEHDPRARDRLLASTDTLTAEIPGSSSHPRSTSNAPPISPIPLEEIDQRPEPGR